MMVKAFGPTHCCKMICTLHTPTFKSCTAIYIYIYLFQTHVQSYLKQAFESFSCFQHQRDMHSLWSTHVNTNNQYLNKPNTNTKNTMLHDQASKICKTWAAGGMDRVCGFYCGGWLGWRLCLEIACNQTALHQHFETQIAFNPLQKIVLGQV